MKFSLTSAAAGALLLAAGANAGGAPVCQEVVVWETETVYVTVAPGFQTPTSCELATIYPTDCTACGYTVCGPLPQYIATEICTTVTCGGKVIPTTYTTGSTCTVNTVCTVDKWGNTETLAPCTKTVTACSFPTQTLLPAGCAYETCYIPEWVIYDNGVPETVPACYVTYTYFPEPSYYPVPYEHTTTAWVNGAPVISVVNNISINIVTATGSVYVGPTSGSTSTGGPSPTSSVSPTGTSGPVSTTTTSPTPSSTAFVLAANDGSVGIVENNIIVFVAADSSAALSSPGMTIDAAGDLVDAANGAIGGVDDTLINSAAGSAVTFSVAQARMLFKRQNNGTTTANATLTWDITSNNILEAFYGSQTCYFFSCSNILKLGLTDATPSGCTAVRLTPESISNLQTGTGSVTAVPSTATAPASSSDTATVAPSSSGTATTASSSSTSPSSTGSSVPTGFAESMVYWHNEYRAIHGVPAVTWNQTLADYAANYASQCSTQHSGGDYGENLAYGGYTNPAYYIYLWYQEGENYNYSNPGFSVSTGHFTQVVWKDTTQIGCGWVTSCAGTLGSYYPNYLACEYQPYGNVDGEYAANVPEPVNNNPPPVPGISLFTNN